MLGDCTHYDEVDVRIKMLDRRISDLESASAHDSAGFARCLDEAEEKRWRYIRLNGRKEPGPGDAWKAPGHTFDTAAKNKANAIEECKALWK